MLGTQECGKRSRTIAGSAEPLLELFGRHVARNFVQSHSGPEALAQSVNVIPIAIAGSRCPHCRSPAWNEELGSLTYADLPSAGSASNGKHAQISIGASDPLRMAIELSASHNSLGPRWPPSTSGRFRCDEIVHRQLSTLQREECSPASRHESHHGLNFSRNRQYRLLIGPGPGVLKQPRRSNAYRSESTCVDFRAVQAQTRRVASQREVPLCFRRRFAFVSSTFRWHPNDSTPHHFPMV